MEATPLLNEKSIEHSNSSKQESSYNTFENGQESLDCKLNETSIQNNLIDPDDKSEAPGLIFDISQYEQKRTQIELFLLEHKRSEVGYLESLRSFALTEGGLIDDKIRERIWPELMSLQPENYEPSPSEEEFKSHPEYTQVVLDVNRSLKRFPPGIPYEQRVAMQDQLIHLILRVIMKYPQLRYYQGYHDVAVTFLLVLGENVAFHIMEKLSTDHLKHFMASTMDKTSNLLGYIYPLLDRMHPQLCEYIERAEVGIMFCLPWFLTWYSHTLTRYEHVVRLYDYFLASPPLLPLYLIPPIIVHRQDIILSTDCDMASLHQVLSQLPEDLPFEILLKKASKLYIEYPPEAIETDSDERARRRLIKQEREREIIAERRKLLRRSKEPKTWQVINRIVPNWMFPYIRFRTFFVSASFAVGLYAYLRYGNMNDLQNVFTK